MWKTKVPEILNCREEFQKVGSFYAFYKQNDKKLRQLDKNKIISIQQDKIS